jgi:4a-hydroxytetrahydrobiopterin dehydratase
MSEQATNLADLLSKHSRELPKGTPPLSDTEINQLTSLLPGWSVAKNQLSNTFLFEDYYRTMAFVNAVAWIAHAENHHPDLEVGYNKCTVHFSTHSVGGLSENDFICAAKVQAMVASKS